MAAKKSGKRSEKKELLRRFERSFDSARLDYKSQAKMVRPKAMLVGFITAGVLYSVLFFLSYWGMTNNKIPLEGFAKLVWILMIPTTVVGFFVWQLAKNRMEYPLRQAIRAYMTELEQDGGLLWRFLPLLDLAIDPNPDIKKAFTWSEQGKIDKLDIEDYTDAVALLEVLLRASDSRKILPIIVDSVAQNFDSQSNAA